MGKPFDFNQYHVTGDKLSPEVKRKALASFVNRYTRDHVPAWAKSGWTDGKAYPVQFASDAEWLKNTRFNVTIAGNLYGNDCYTSNQTWPDNPELRKA